MILEQYNKLDNRLVVIETLVAERNQVSLEQQTQILFELREIKKELGILKVRTAGVSALVAVAVGFITHKLF
jgi:hypothetical protein